MGLRIRRADSAPSPRADELYGRTPESVIGDRDLSLGAKSMYAAITLAMVEQRNRVICLSTMTELAELLGVKIRQARRLVAELEARKHVVRERVRTISGSPQGIRPTARLKPARTRSDPTDCNRSDVTAQPVVPDRPTGQIRPSARSCPTGPSYREGEDEILKRRTAAVDSRKDSARPPAVPDQPETEDPDAIAAALAALHAVVHPHTKKSPGGETAKSTPEAETGNSIPEPKCTGNPRNKSRRNAVRKHNSHT